jgi:hypothetical protein
MEIGSMTELILIRFEPKRQHRLAVSRYFSLALRRHGTHLAL